MMKASDFSISVKICSVLILSFLLGHLPLLAEEYVDEFSEVVPFVEGGKVVVETFGGSVLFSCGDVTDVKIEATRIVDARDEAEAKEIFSEFRIHVKKSPSKIKVETVYPKKNGFLSRVFGGFKYRNIRVEYKLTVPCDVDLFIDGTSTDVEGSGVKGRVSLDLTSGDVNLENIGGHVYVDGTSGDVSVAGVEGELSIDNTSGEITAVGVTGDVNIDKTSGRVIIKNVGGELYLDGTSCDLDVEKLAGNAEIDLTSGDVLILGLGGGAVLEGTSGDVTIVFEGKPENPSSINTTSGGVELRFVEGSSMNLKLETHSGWISAKLPAMEIIEVSSDNLKAVVDGGGVDVAVSTSSGDIVIKSK